MMNAFRHKRPELEMLVYVGAVLMVAIIIGCGAYFFGPAAT
jgi:hypothetical protein